MLQVDNQARFFKPFGVRLIPLLLALRQIVYDSGDCDPLHWPGAHSPVALMAARSGVPAAKAQLRRLYFALKPMPDSDHRHLLWCLGEAISATLAQAETADSCLRLWNLATRAEAIGLGALKLSETVH